MHERRNPPQVTACPSVAHNATKRVPNIQVRAGCGPSFDAGDEASDLDNDEDGLPLRFDCKLRRLKPLLNSLLDYNCVLTYELRVTPNGR
jgi:hypothetical protein